MRVFVAGATGVAGRRAARDLVAAGQDVSGVARSPSKAALLQSLGAMPVEVDLFDANEVQRAVTGHDAVVNLATSIPTSAARMGMRSAWRENDRIRRQISRNLVEAAIATRAECLIQESIAFMYEDRKDDWIDEDVPIESAPHADSALEAEGQARRFTESGGRGIALRFGQFYAADAPHTVMMVKVARRDISPFVGPPAPISLSSMLMTSQPPWSRPYKRPPGSTTLATTSRCDAMSSQGCSPGFSVSASSVLSHTSE